MVLTTFLADLRGYSLTVGPPKSPEKPSVENLTSSSRIDLRTQLLALTIGEPNNRKKTPLRSSVKSFLTACSRVFGDIVDDLPHAEHPNNQGALRIFGALGPFCCEAVRTDLPPSQLKSQDDVQITLNKVLDETHVENEPSLQSEIICSLYNLVKSMMSSPYVDNASFFALMERSLKSLNSDIEVPPILTDLMTHDSVNQVTNGCATQKAELIYDLLSVGLTEVLEGKKEVAGPAASTVSKPNHLDAMEIAMRKQVKKAVEESHASTLTALQQPVREQNWETMKALLWPIADRLSLSGPQLFEAVFQLLTSDRPDDHIQEELIDFLGLDQFDAVSNLIADRAAWILWHKKYRIDPQGVQNDGASKSTKKGKSRKQRRGNRSATDATDQSLMNDAAETDVVDMLLNNPAALARDREEQLMAAAASSRSRFAATKTSYDDTQQPKLPFVFDALAEARGRTAFSGVQKMALPEGATHGHKDDWDFFDFPVPEKNTLDFLNVPVIEINQLDRIGQIAFKGIERLNPIQSIVFDAAYNSSENLLICAPTGAGKTNTAMLTVVRLIREHLNEDFVLDLKAFKIVYMAPMKALAAEMTATFSKRLNPLGIKVRECTGDMQLSKQEIMDTQMLVTTPEKWDVISRKGAGDASLVQALKLLIIDEVHLLHEDRGAVIEALVARTLRQVEVSQSMIRIVGLSATLPNYVDVAQFLRVNLNRGLFYFDSRFRPVPLGMSFLGVTPPNRHSQEEAMNEACYQKVIEQLRRDEQVMVFVHARGETSKTARWIRDAAVQRGDVAHFQPLVANTVDLFKRVPHCHDATVRELAVQGIACHHAGMLRPDRRLVEQLFSNRVIRVLVCTATLAWGVNLPAHAVVIKGTKIYDADKSDFVDLDILDVVQIFGRAGRPQFDTFGLATIITTRDKLDHYVRLITNQVAIESKLLSNINDHLNAEIALGTVTNIDEAVTWLSYTYLFVRLQRSPLNYGITPAMLQEDPDFTHFMTSALRKAALELDKAEMVRYEESTGQLASTDRGRTASLYYIKYETAALVKDAMHPLMLIADLFALISQAEEFSSMKVRDEEENDLLDLQDNACHVPVKNPGTVDSNIKKKINVLLQAYISRQQPRTHSLISDMNYIQQNAGRLARYMFEIAVRRGWAVVASHAHRLSKMIERQMWYDESPLWQVVPPGKARLLERVEEMGLTVDRIRELGANELKDILRYEGKNGAQAVFEMAQCMPVLRMSVDTQPITRNIIRCHIKLEPDFKWVLSQHGQQLLYWIWIEDPEEATIYHSEVFTLQKKAALSGEPAELDFTIPVHEPIPPQYLVRCMPDRWLGAESVVPVILRNILLPQTDPPHTDLLNLDPLPITALKNPEYESIFNFTHFNPIQTQIFHSLYHQDVNILLGSPTGSGKTVAAELAILRVFNTAPKKKCIYIAPLKALVRERVDDWSVKIGEKLGKRVVELTGDVTPDIGILRRADVIVTTPEKWDGISRMWRQRAYVRDIALIIIDEIHMVGEERGPVLEVIVSRANFIANQLNQTVRIVGLSTALANAVDMAAWLRVPLSPESAPDQGQSGLCGRGLFNFRPSVRPVPLEVHIQGYAGRHYCPRMATMNRPIFQAIQTHSPSKPVLIFVASRRQTRRTAFDLMSFSQSASNPQQWLHMDVQEMENLAATLVDNNLQMTLPYGIGLHHAGLRDRDRRIVEELFVNQKIQVLIATSTLAWGVNFPAHLVIIKGTEYFDGKTKRYVDFPITDVLQMMGRAGRPQFDNEGKAVVMVQDTKKAFYKRFLYEPFPVESCLPQVLADYLNAEIATGSVSTMQSALECITWTFFFRRLMMNPNYYHLEETTADAVNRYLSEVVSGAVNSLIENSCVEQDPEDPLVLIPTSAGRLASFYYLSHKTIGLFTSAITASTTIAELLYIVSLAEEFALLPVRHAEDETNAILAREMPLPVKGAPESPHTKAHILLQAYLSRRTLELPVSDYVTDTKSVLDQVPRVLQAAIDYCAENGWLVSTLHAILLTQMISQALWLEDSSLLQLPGINSSHLAAFVYPNSGEYIESLPELLEAVQPPPYSRINDLLFDHLSPDLIKPIKQALGQFPVVTVSLDLIGPDPASDSPEAGDCCRPLPIVGLDVAASSESALPVFCDTDYALSVDFRSHVPAALAARSRASTNKAPRGAAPTVKSRDPGWILVLGAVGRNSSSSSGADSCLLALRKISGSQMKHCDTSSRAFTVSFRLDSDLFPPGRLAESVLRLHLYVMSDTYLALDQQLPFELRVLPLPPSCPRRMRAVCDEMEM